MDTFLKHIWSRISPHLPSGLVGWVVALLLVLVLIIASAVSWHVFVERDAVDLGPLRVRVVPQAEGIPIGAVIPYFGSLEGSPPDGYELCDGELVTTQGSPINGMRKPDLLGRFPRGAREGTLLADALKSGGAAEVVLTLEQLPPHQHDLPYHLMRDEIERHSNYVREYIGTGNHPLGDSKTLAENRSQEPVKIEPPYQEVFFLIKVF